MDIQLSQITNNIEQQLNELKGFTATPGEGVTRFPFTKEAKEAVGYLASKMQALGLKTAIDASGAVIGRLEGQKKETVMIGSHYDSVRYGGAYDGIAGVVCGLETAKLFIQNGIVPKYSLEIIATNDEEGARFKSGFFSSKAMLGEMSLEELKKLKDAEEISIYEAMKEWGLNPEDIYLAKRDLKTIKSFIEIHIEQGRLLEAHQKEIGIVKTIVGMQRYMVTILGRSDHAGTTPMDMRIDAVEAASKIISGVGDYARKYQGAVATVGHLKVFPNEINTIAEKVVFSMDIRCTCEESIQAIYQEFVSDIETITAKYKAEYLIENTMTITPVHMDQVLCSKIEAACKERGCPYESINSGAGHDSLPIARKISTAMLFVPSKDGRSHCKEEFTESHHLAKAVLIAFDVINKLR